LLARGEENTNNDEEKREIEKKREKAGGRREEGRRREQRDTNRQVWLYMFDGRTGAQADVLERFVLLRSVLACLTSQLHVCVCVFVCVSTYARLCAPVISY
jgi:hypothetical protein